MSQALPLTACTTADDQTEIRVDITTAETTLPLSVRNCSHQWLANGAPLDDDANANDAGVAQAEMNQRYQDLMRAIDITQCEKLLQWRTQVRAAKH